MTIEKIEDYAERIRELIASQFEGKDKIEAFLVAFSKQVQDFENIAFDVLLGRAVSTAVGVNLDRLGAIVGEARNGLTDELYRAAIETRIQRNLSNGETDRIVQIVAAMTDASSVTLTELFPANISVQVNGGQTLIVGLSDIIKSFVAAGVNVVASQQVDPDEPLFGFEGDDTAAGFGDALTPEFGGRFLVAI